MKNKFIISTFALLFFVIIFVILYFIISGKISIKQSRIQKYIDQSLDRKTARSSISECIYQDKKVYYIVHLNSNDDYNYLLDIDNNKICSPNGGKTGRGNEKCPNFDSETCKLLGYSSKYFN